MRARERNEWMEWLKSSEGREASNFDSLTSSPYLENRLWRAFMAGRKARDDMADCLRADLLSLCDRVRSELNQTPKEQETTT